jgi:hypothetical protein
VFDTPLIIRKAACCGVLRWVAAERCGFSPKEGVASIFLELPAAIFATAT